jgi:BirA family biotin operon repressor/biotin-[acetyl-CoA-carboxylase] ligase
MNNTQKKIIVLDRTDSTNNYASQLVDKGVTEGTVVLAHYQEKGRGYKENYWESEAGKNLLASIVLYPVFLPAGRQFQLSKVISLALVEFLKKEIPAPKIKWPNDIYYEQNKIAGILIENSVKGEFLNSSIIGFGLNVNQIRFLSDAPNPVSLKQITGEEYQISQVLNQIFRNFQRWFAKLKAGKYREIDAAYYENLYQNTGWHKFKGKGQEFEAQIKGIGEFGQLQLEKRTGELAEYQFKEVEFR